MDCIFGVEASGDRAAQSFDSCDGGLRGAGHNNIDWCCEGSSTAGKEFDPVFDAVYSPCRSKFAEGDWFGRVDPALVDPILDPIEINGRHFKGEAIKERLEKVREVIWKADAIARTYS